MFGLLNVHKPAGITSRQVVDRVLRVVRPEKAGHAGTLDPLATGVLVVGIGQATRLVEYVQHYPKTYEATFLLGQVSTTEDIEGEITLLPDAAPPTLRDLQQAAAGLVGSIEQRPPAFSALKVAGRRAYALARAGEQVELAARTIEIHRLEITAYEYPRLQLTVDCGSGTYVRSLGRDLAERAGTGAVMSALVRTAIGPYALSDALPIADVTADTVVANLQAPMTAVAGHPKIVLTADQSRLVTQGRPIERPTTSADAQPVTQNQPEVWAAVDQAGELIALLQPKQGRLAPFRCFTRGPQAFSH